MNRIRLIVLVGVFGVFLVPARAQKVVAEGSGGAIKVIINASDMPHTTEKKVQGTTATNSSKCKNDRTDLASEVSNVQIYQKFEVSKEDYSSKGTDWLNAINHCKALTHNGSKGWRLPTQRELMLIWALKTKLEEVNGFNKFTNGSYWSATENDSNNSWYLDITDGNTTHHTKNSEVAFVRCVRDL